MAIDLQHTAHLPAARIFISGCWWFLPTYAVFIPPHGQNCVWRRWVRT